MLPRLVANKLLRVPWGSNSFNADPPGSELSLGVITNSDEPEGPALSKPSERTRKYRLFASTWNVGGIPPSGDLSLEDWLDTSNNSYDIYVLGFQEIVPLSAKNVIGPEKSMISTEWNSIIRATLNKSTSNTKEASQCMLQDYQCIISKQMVGILITVWVRGDLRQYIRNASVSCIGCGIMGCLGNKGSVSVRFFLHETSFCFVCCHLASGGREGDEMHRNIDAMEIFSRTRFLRVPSLPRKILDHDRVILLGDLNYRISLPHGRTQSLVEQKEWHTLLKNDQLRLEVSEGRPFDGWHEGKIAFSPTYKYCQNSDEYYGCFHGKKGEKRRAPAWCDRVLWYGRGLTQTNYDRCESRLSDHRPVRAFFTVEADVSRNPKSLRNLFLSERFDHIKTHFNGFTSSSMNSSVVDQTSTNSTP